jgi:large subunit ribosomal protein L22
MKGFSFPYDPEIHAAARGIGLNISPKAAREVCKALKGMDLEKAKNYLGRVIEMDQAVPFKRHDGKVGHRRGKGMSTGRYPVKTAAAILKVIESAGNNGEAIHIDIENWRILHIATSRGTSFESRFPRARGRATPKMRESANVEVVLEEIK